MTTVAADPAALMQPPNEGKAKANAKAKAKAKARGGRSVKAPPAVERREATLQTDALSSGLLVVGGAQVRDALVRELCDTVRLVGCVAWVSDGDLFQPLIDRKVPVCVLVQREAYLPARVPAPAPASAISSSSSSSSGGGGRKRKRSEEDTPDQSPPPAKKRKTRAGARISHGKKISAWYGQCTPLGGAFGEAAFRQVDVVALKAATKPKPKTGAGAAAAAGAAATPKKKRARKSWFGNAPLMHHKFLVLTKATGETVTVVGSYNLTANASKSSESAIFLRTASPAPLATEAPAETPAGVEAPAHERLLMEEFWRLHAISTPIRHAV